MTGADLIEQFCNELHTYHGISEKRRKFQRLTLAECEAHIGHELEAMTADELRAYLTTLVTGGLHPKTVAGRLYAIRPYIRWLWKKEMIDADRLMRLLDVEPPRGHNAGGKPNPYSRKEIQAFWREFDEKYPLPRNHEDTIKRWLNGTKKWSRVQPIAKRFQMKAIVALALAGGLRRDEIWRVELIDVDPLNEYILVHGARKNPQAEAEDRVVPWTTEWMQDALAEWLWLRERIDPPHDRIWLSLHQDHYRKPMRHRQFEVLMRFGRGWGYQRMRHTAATELLRAGYALEHVQKIMGHRNIQQTLGYAKILTDDLVRRARNQSSRLEKAIGPPC